MKAFRLTFALGPILVVAAWADPKTEVTDAIRRLLDAPSFSWEVRHARFGPGQSSGSMRLPAMVAGSGLRISGLYESGMTEKDGFTVISVHGTAERLFGGPQIVASRGTRNRIAETPKGWLTDLEIRSILSDVGGESVTINGTHVFLRDALAEAGRALSAIRPDLQLPLLVQDLASFERVGRFIVCELSEAGKSRRSGRYPSSDQPVTVVFELTNGQVSSYFVSNFKTTSMVGIAVVLKDVGRTSVVLPQAAFDALMR